MNQNISYYATSRIVADSQGYLKFTIETSEEWNEYVKVAQFTKDGKTYDVPDVRPGVEYTVPWEALVGGGTMFVSLFGIAGEANRATTNELELNVYDSGFHEGDPSTDPTPDKWQQFVNQVIDAKDEAVGAKNEAEKFANEAKQQANNAATSADSAYKSSQLAQKAATKAEQAVGNSEIFAESAKEFMEQAQEAAVKAGESAVKAELSETKAKLSEEAAKASEKAAKASEESAHESAAKAEANQQIVTETKAEIDVIYEDIKGIGADVTEKHVDVVNKAAIVSSMHEQVGNWYNNFLTGVEYVEFTEQMQTEDTDGWVQAENSQEYVLFVADSSKMIMSVQILVNGTYYITPFCDVVFAGNELELHAIAPFAGRVALHALISNTNSMEVQQ